MSSNSAINSSSSKPNALGSSEIPAAGTSRRPTLFQPRERTRGRRKWIKTRAREIAKEAAEQESKTANEAAKRAGEEVQPTLDQGKEIAQDFANRAPEVGRQAVGQAGEFVESVAPQPKEVASNLYDQGSQAGEYVRKHIAQEPLAGMLVAGLIGYMLGYLIHRR